MHNEHKILFKAISVDENDWCIGSPIINPTDGEVYLTYFSKEFNDNDNFTLKVVMKKIYHDTLCVFLGVYDNNNKPIFSNDIVEANNKTFRIYLSKGGQTFKVYYWASNIDDLKITDQLITEPISDLQNLSFIENSSIVIGNYFDNKIKKND